MRTVHSLFLALVLLLGLALPAAGQGEAPAAGGVTSVYLPQVGVGQGAPTAVVEDHVLVLGAEPEPNPLPKPAAGPEGDGRRSEPFVLPPPPEPNPPAAAPAAVDEGAAPDAWIPLIVQNFDLGWPSRGWRVFDANGGYGGERYWDEDDFMPRNGPYSAWPGKGGPNGQDPNLYYYANDMNSWMIYGPVSLADASSAYLSFDYWLSTEASYDYFGWYASSDGLNFYGQRTSGDSAGWLHKDFSLGAVPIWGSMLDNGSVWIAFVFTSDFSNSSYDGVFVDNVYAQKYRPHLNAHYYAGTDFNTYKFSGWDYLPLGRTWGSGGPGYATDYFSLWWEGNVNFNAGTYAFYVRSDDGARVRVDGVEIIDTWYPHGLLTATADRTLTAGTHYIEVEFFDATGAASIDFWYTRKSE